MKKYLVTANKFLLLFIVSFLNTLAWAQDSTVAKHSTTTTTTKTTSEFVMQPWMWVVGGVVLLVILVALLRGNSNKEVSRTTIVRENSDSNV